MIRSMTGYARTETVCPWGKISCELRSVNHRYFDLQFKMPDELRAVETELRTAAQASLTRGKIDCAIRVQYESQSTDSVKIDYSRLEELKAVIERVGDIFGPLTASDPIRLLSFPGVMQVSVPNHSSVLDDARKVFADTLSEFAQMRAREGARIGEFLRERCDTIATLTTQVRTRYSEVRHLWLDRLRARIAEFDVDVEPQRLDQELVMALQRLDVDEELQRLASHLDEVRSSLERKDAIGRRLDFLMQELNREANTLSSKSQDAEMTRCAVEIKVLIEQMREQVQNIE